METAYKTSLSAAGKAKIDFGQGHFIDVGATDQIKFGEVSVPAHSKAGYDAGHPGADEIFYVAKGTATIFFPASDESEVVAQGNYIMMPRGLPHEIHNSGDEDCKVLFFGIVL